MKQNGWQKQDLTKTDFPTGSTLDKIRTQISPFSDSPYLDALVLLSWITSQSKTYTLTYPTPNLTKDQSTKLEAALSQIKSGIPLPYILGSWEFYQTAFKITPDVLIPRPETEGLVERAITWLEAYPTKRTCLDLGTGSGCIAVTLALHISDLNVFATDYSYPALMVARENAQIHQVKDRVHLINTDLLSGISPEVDLLITNLPYIPSGKLKTLPVSRSEPNLALNGGPDGLVLIRETLVDVPELINPGSLILIEVDESRGKAAQDFAMSVFPQGGVRIEQDLSGQDRYLIIQT
jgi:release factor glutamine methyltransferase